MYCSVADLEKRLPASVVATLTDDSAGANLDVDIANEAIADASAIIDGYISTRYQLPLATPVPIIIVRLCSDIAIYKLATRKFDHEMPEAMTERYNNSIKILDKIATGRINIADIGENEPVNAPQVASNKTASDRMFGREVLNRW